VCEPGIFARARFPALVSLGLKMRGRLPDPALVLRACPALQLFAASCSVPEPVPPRASAARGDAHPETVLGACVQRLSIGRGVSLDVALRICRHCPAARRLGLVDSDALLLGVLAALAFQPLPHLAEIAVTRTGPAIAIGFHTSMLRFVLAHTATLRRVALFGFSDICLSGPLPEWRLRAPAVRFETR
jgi:hypothetical protein